MSHVRSHTFIAELAHALREIRADLPVVMTSGYITEELRAKAHVAGIRELSTSPTRWTNCARRWRGWRKRSRRGRAQLQRAIDPAATIRRDESAPYAR